MAILAQVIIFGFPLVAKVALVLYCLEQAHSFTRVVLGLWVQERTMAIALKRMCLSPSDAVETEPVLVTEEPSAPLHDAMPAA